MANRTIILGMGNPILCDDAVGVRLARDFSAQVQHLSVFALLGEPLAQPNRLYLPVIVGGAR
jgi:Ni,Fe-hydrogenase maturation factor